jgi:SsrA-binding protein
VTSADGIKVVANNRAAFHEYFIIETIEAGLELLGTEVKSIRDGKVNIKDGFVRVDYQPGPAAGPGGPKPRARLEAYLENVTIQPWEAGNRNNHVPTRPRRLLLHRREIAELFGRSREKGLTMVPLRLYFKGGRAKVEVALVKGKKTWDKREAIAEREAKREMERVSKRIMAE